MRGILTMVHLTLQEARRRRLLLSALLFGLAFLSLFATGFHFIHRDLMAHNVLPAQRKLILSSVMMAGFYAVNFLMVMTAVLVPVDTLSGEISSGVIQTVAAKPLHRFQIILGKWIGFSLILALYLGLMAGGLVLVGKVLGGVTLLRIGTGVSLMGLEGTLLLTLSIAGGTRLTTIANGVTVLGLYGLAFIGGWMEQIGTLLGNATTRYVGIVASLFVPSESLWQLAAYHMQPPLMRDLNLTPFSPASVPSGYMILWAVSYTLAVLSWALWQFHKRNL